MNGITCKRIRAWAACGPVVLLAACGGAGTEPAPTAAAKVNVGGTVSGLGTGTGTGTGSDSLVLMLNDDAAATTTISQNGSFTLGSPLAQGASYSVTVKLQPAGQMCLVGSGSGVVPASASAVTSLVVTCTPVDVRPLQLQLTAPPHAPAGALMAYLIAEQQGIALTRISWFFDGVAGGRQPVGMASLATPTAAAGGEFKLQVWNRPGPHTVRVVATASNGRSAETTMTVNVASQPLVAGAAHSCAITAAGGVKCWGWGHEWQLGNSSQNDQASPVDVPGLTGIVGLAAGGTFTCALRGTGTVACWGDGSTGVTGPAANYASSLTPLTVAGLNKVVAISAGRYHACALKDDGSVACWGSNESWQLGWAVNAAKTFTPTVVPGLADVVAIASGNSFNCAIKADTTVACWGNPASGQLGVAAGTAIPNGQPMVVQSSQGGALSGVLSLSLGSDHACAIVDTGSSAPGSGFVTQCWGNNANNQSGASGVAHDTARPVAGQTGVVMLATSRTSTCSLDVDFAFRCWGSNAFGESDGTGAAPRDVVQPTLLAGLQGAESPDFAAGGEGFLCALLQDGTARCVGRGGSGQLGAGALADAKTLQTVNAPRGTFWNWSGNGLR